MDRGRLFQSLLAFSENRRPPDLLRLTLVIVSKPLLTDLRALFGVYDWIISSNS